MSELRIGTSAFTAAGWPGTFYPPGMQPRDFLTFYATKFDTVEVDSTFYHTPSASTVTGWNAKTPKGFVFALKVPQIITHDKCLVDCDEEFREFIRVADLLGDKLGPMLFQFGYFNQRTFATVDDFLAVLKPFLAKLPAGYRFAVEIRNKHWLVPKLVDTLRQHHVALALIDQGWMPRPWELKLDMDLITADDFTYVRLLGDRKAIEEITTTWEKVVVDRSVELRTWVNYLQPIKRRGVTIFTYANNHYAGFGPATVAQFLSLWDKANE